MEWVSKYCTFKKEDGDVDCGKMNRTTTWEAMPSKSKASLQRKYVCGNENTYTVEVSFIKPQ